MSSDLRQILSRFEGQKIAVWGDLILDRYIYTSTSRISREAPVLVAEFEREDSRLGGAGNVVMNLLTLGAIPIPVGFLGHDNEGQQLLDLLQKHGIDVSLLLSGAKYRTPVKSRILAGGDNTRKQQVLRVDTIHRGEIPLGAYRKLEDNLKRAATICSGLVISDYLGQAVKPEVFSSFLAHQPGIPVMADSRENLADFSGVTVATPNEPEMRKIFANKKFNDDNDFLESGNALLSQLGALGVVLKRGRHGMIVFEKGKTPRLLDIFGTTEIVDVTGAGDTVLAVIGLGFVSGATIFEAAQLANIAGGIVVMREGASPIPRRELLDALP